MQAQVASRSPDNDTQVTAEVTEVLHSFSATRCAAIALTIGIDILKTRYEIPEIWSNIMANQSLTD